MPYVWPFCPLDGLQESLEWSTEVLSARADEQRIAARGAPRQAFQGQYALNELAYSRARALVFGQYGEEIYLPVWPEFERIGAVASGATSLSVPTTEADYRADSLALLWQGNAWFEVVQIATVTPTALNLAAPVDQNYSAALVMPLRRAWITEAVKADRDEPGFQTLSASFEVIDNVDLGDSIGLDTYRGLDVMTDVPIIATGLSDSLSLAVDDMDNGVGPRYRHPLRRWIDETTTLSWDLADRTALWRLRTFLHRMRGRQKAFWIPTWNGDLEILSDISPATTSLTISAIGWPDHYGARDILIRSTTGVDRCLRVASGAAGLAGQETLALLSAAGFTLTAEDVHIASLLLPMRLDADRIEIQHEAGGFATARAPATALPTP